MACIGETLVRTFGTEDSTGAAVNADSLPTGLLRRNGVTVGSAVVTVTNRATGAYSASVLMDAAHGWVVGDSWALECACAVGGVSLRRPIAQGRVDGDAFARIGADGAGLTVLGTATDQAEILSRLPDATPGGAGGLPVLDEAGELPVAVALSTSDISDVADEVWQDATRPRTLTQSAAAVTAAVTGSDVVIAAGDLVTVTLTGLTVPAHTELLFAVKRGRGVADADALLLVSESAGLEVVNGAAATTAANASLTATSTSATLVLKAAATGLLAGSGALAYGLKAIRTSDGQAVTLTEGEAKVITDVVRAQS